MNKRAVCSVVVALALIGNSPMAMSGNSQVQNLTLNVNTFNELAVASSALTLTVDTVTTVGNNPDTATSATTYALTTNDAQRKITAQLNTALPAGLTLKVNLAAPGGSGGTSAGDVDITDATSKDVVTAINKVANSGRALTYKLDADVSAGAQTALARTVTLTLVAG